MLSDWKVVGFSGHRKLKNREAAADGIRHALDHLAANHTPLAAVCSAASGGDTLFLEEVARRKLPFELILPFSKARFEQDFTRSEWQRVLPFFGQARSVEEIRGAKSDKEAYLLTGILTVEKSDVMIFLWNSRPAAGLGGTGDVVNYARKLKKPLLVIEPETGGIREEWLDPLISGSFK